VTDELIEVGGDRAASEAYVTGTRDAIRRVRETTAAAPLWGR
jgi:hypothetical protein